MLKKEENQQLFESILNSLYGQDYAKSNSELANKTELSDEELNNVTHLDLFANSMAGIGKLSNLKSLRVYMYTENAIAESYPNATAGDLGAIYDAYNQGQIKDITPLYQCKKLENFTFNNQRFITEIDLSNWPDIKNVSMQACPKLRGVTGFGKTNTFERLFTEEDFAKSCHFDFTECFSLTKIDDLRAIVDHTPANFDALGNPIFELPIESFIRLANSSNIIDDYLSKYDLQRNDIIAWTENRNKNFRPVYTAHQVKMIKERLDAITDTVCDESMKPMDKILSVYNWVTHHMTYNSQVANDAQRLYAETGSMASMQREVSQNSSSYQALFEHNAICGGVSNLFNAFVINLGYQAEPCGCDLREVENDNRVLAQSKHQISRVIAKTHKGEEFYYYCDPTWDINSDVPGSFLMNKEEAMQEFVLGIDTYPDKNGPELIKQIEKSVENINNWQRSKQNLAPNSIQNTINTSNMANVEQDFSSVQEEQMAR